jgi:cytidyltransferase-like protein
MPTQINTIPVVSGGFDPVHSGHLQLIQNAAQQFGHSVIVLLNSDDWLARKKGKPFLPFSERYAIMSALKHVHAVIGFDDSDNTACDGLAVATAMYPHDQLVFCNGGDRTQENIPEMQVEGIQFAFGIGGDHKTNSSSWILRDAVASHAEQRVWGKFADLYTTTGCKVKELVIAPKSGISYQRHFKRSEIWYVRSGEGFVRYSHSAPSKHDTIKLFKDDIFVVKKGTWHQLYNESDKDLIIIEIQYGEETTETDIERLEYYEYQKSNH